MIVGKVVDVGWTKYKYLKTRDKNVKQPITNWGIMSIQIDICVIFSSKSIWYNHAVMTFAPSRKGALSPSSNEEGEKKGGKKSLTNKDVQLRNKKENRKQTQLWTKALVSRRIVSECYSFSQEITSLHIYHMMIHIYILKIRSNLQNAIRKHHLQCNVVWLSYKSKR